MRSVIAMLGTCALGRTIGADAQPLDGGLLLRGKRVRVGEMHVAIGERGAISKPFYTGVRVLDALLTLGRGARIGLFGAPGVGKSSLLHAIVRGSQADAVVVALVGERGREAWEWMRNCTSRETVVCATGDRACDERIRAVNVALAQADALRRRGLHVLLVLDSLARCAYALRERAIAAGEASGRGGFPPSVFAHLARAVELAGVVGRGSITLIATVLDDGDERDPVSDCARSLLDGHIALSSDLACSGRFPAVDVVASTSRTMRDVVAPAHLRQAACVRKALAWLARTAEARALGLQATDAGASRALEAEAALDRLLLQSDEPAHPAQTLARLAEAADILER